MKNLFVTSLTFVILASITLSCGKESNEMQQTKNNVNQSDEQLVTKVENFITLAQDVKNGKILKNDDKMPIPDATAYIDESFNYEYCFHTEPYGKIITETVEVILPIIQTEEKVYTVDAAAGYNEAVAKVRNKYLLIGNQDKKLLGIMVKNLGLYNNSNIKLQITAQIGTGTPSVRTDDPTYSMDFWWVRDSHNCDETLFDYGGAPNIIEGEVFAYWRTAPAPNTRVWFTNSQNYFYNAPTAYDNPNDQTIDNYCDYSLFYATARVSPLDYNVQCLSGEGINNEISTYVTCAGTLIEEKISQVGLNFQNVQYESITGNDGIYLTIEHHMQLTLGVKHSIQISTTYPINIGNTL